MLAVLLPMLNQKTVTATDSAGGTQRVLTKSDDGISSLLPLLLIMPGMSSGDASKGRRSAMGRKPSMSGNESRNTVPRK